MLLRAVGSAAVVVAALVAPLLGACDEFVDGEGHLRRQRQLVGPYAIQHAAYGHLDRAALHTLHLELGLEDVVGIRLSA